LRELVGLLLSRSTYRVQAGTLASGIRAAGGVRKAADVILGKI
jgi:UDP:flavonoid glycosyltransferase YjiC (YdhE family)